MTAIGQKTDNPVVQLHVPVTIGPLRPLTSSAPPDILAKTTRFCTLLIVQQIPHMRAAGITTLIYCLKIGCHYYRQASAEPLCGTRLTEIQKVIYTVAAILSILADRMIIQPF